MVVLHFDHCNSCPFVDKNPILNYLVNPVNSVYFLYKSDCEKLPGVAIAIEGATWTGVVARDGKLMLQVSVPVVIGPEVWGTFTSYSALDGQLARNLRGVTNSGEVAFVARGQVMAASRVLPATLPTPQDEPKLVTLGGVSYYALYAPLPHANPRAGLGFVSLRPYQLTAAMLSRFRMALAIVAAGSLLLTLMAGAILARSITQPLDGVVEAARTVREGKWPEKFNTQRQDEIGLLQAVFDEMTTAMQTSQERLLALIDTDNLTGLDNHRRFQERISQEATRCAASGESLSLLLFDLDHFSEFNHKHGHHEGDAALKKAALILRNVLPEVAIVARYGGEEFAALLPQCDLAWAERYAEQVRGLMAGGEKDSGEGKGEKERPTLSLSVGCAEFGTQTKQAEGLILAAELAVSQAKQLGRNRVCRFDSVPGADENADPYQLHKFLKDSSLATIQALAAAVDAKDPLRRAIRAASLNTPAGWRGIWACPRRDRIALHDGNPARRGKNRRSRRHPEKAGTTRRRRTRCHGNAPGARRSDCPQSPDPGPNFAGSAKSP